MQDKLLRDAVSVYGDDWVSISAYIAGRKHSTIPPALPARSPATSPAPLQGHMSLPSLSGVPAETAVVAAIVTSTSIPDAHQNLDSNNSIIHLAQSQAIVPFDRTSTLTGVQTIKNFPNDRSQKIAVADFSSGVDGSTQSNISIERVLRTTPNPHECAHRWNTSLCPHTGRYPAWSQEEVKL